MEYRRNRTLLGGFQFKVEHGADEVGELGVSFGSTGNGIKRCLRIRLSAAGRCIGRRTVSTAGELGEVTFVVMGIESLGFFEGVEVRDVVSR